MKRAAFALLLVACAARGGRRERAPSPEIAAGDALFERRNEDGALVDAAMDAWRGVLAEQPGNSRVLGRMARAWWVRSLTSDTARTDLEAGEEAGWSCLLAHPAFSAAVAVRGYEVGEDAVETLARDAVPCMVWTVVNALDLVALRGPGSDLVLAEVGPLVARYRTLAPQAEDGFGAWAAARLRLATAAAGDSDARRLFEEAIEQNPDVLVFRLSYAAAFPDARDRVLPMPHTDATDRWSYENAALRARMGE